MDASHPVQVSLNFMPAPATTLCAWSFDRDTPVANAEALYRTVESWTRGRPQMRQGSAACRQPGAPRRQFATEASQKQGE
jgi:hypothetical protein